MFVKSALSADSNLATMRANIGFVNASDTTPRAQQLQSDIHQSMSAVQKIIISYEMSMFARELQRATLLREHPEWSEGQIRRELLRLAFFPPALAGSTAMTFPEVLQRIAAVLDRCGIPYMLTGSFASVAYGSPRSTQDIDLVIEADASRLRALATNLPSGEYHFEFEDAIEALKRESLFNVIDQRTGWKIDMVIRKSRPFSRENSVVGVRWRLMDSNYLLPALKM